MLPGGTLGRQGPLRTFLEMVAGSAHSAIPSSVIALLNPQWACLLLEDASPNHLGQLLDVAPGVGLHTGPGARQSVESLLHTTAELQHLRVPLAHLPQQAPGENTGMSVTLGIERQGGRNTQGILPMHTKPIFLPFFPSQQPSPTYTEQVLPPQSLFLPLNRNKGFSPLQ